MLQKLRGTNEKGFTLIELMIVIAIIGILAAIAIPNFINYRNKSYCSAAESDAANLASSIADYFTDPDNLSVSTDSDLSGVTMSGKGDAQNDYTITQVEADDSITIVVTDKSERCPSGSYYTLSMPKSPGNDGWSE